uniref:Uncharacterized protein n=1 Tax=Aegilops tauschii TaxID=37682 RepID=M8B4Y7_AEGTA
MTVTRSSAEDPHAAAGEQQQQAADKAPRTTEQEPAPKRRPKAVEDKLQKLFPGQTLPEVTRARYMVRQKKQKKRPGLRAMAEEDALSSKRRDSDDDAAGEKKHFGVTDAEERASRRKRG